MTHHAANLPVSSPCTGVCRLGSDGLCQGCQRSMQEIVGWRGMSEDQRRHIMHTLLPQRRSQAP